MTVVRRITTRKQLVGRLWWMIERPNTLIQSVEDDEFQEIPFEDEQEASAVLTVDSVDRGPLSEISREADTTTMNRVTDYHRKVADKLIVVRRRPLLAA